MSTVTPEELARVSVEVLHSSTQFMGQITKSNENLLGSIQDINSQFSLQHVHTVVPNFEGKRSEYRNWIRSIQKFIHLTGVKEDEADAKGREVAFQTARGPVDDTIRRHIDANKDITWKELRTILRARYSDLSDNDMALDHLNKMVQTKSDSPAAFAEEIHEIALEAYDDTENVAGNPIIQRNLVTIFIDGLASSDIARKVMRAKPKTLSEATTVAMTEYQLHEKFKLHHKMPRQQKTNVSVHETLYREEEPMDVSYVQSTFRSQGSGQGQSQGSRRSCYFCGRTNHIKKDCLYYKRWQERYPTSQFKDQTKGQSQTKGQGQPKREGYRGQAKGQGDKETRRCYKCGQVGHLKKSCKARAQKN